MARHDVIQFGYYGEDLDFKKYGIAPAAFELYLEMPGTVLSDSYPPAVVSEAFEETVEPCGYIGASTAHEVDFPVGYHERLEHEDLLAEFFRKAIGLDRIVAVVESVFYLCAREILYHGAAHGELIEIVVGEMSDNLSHVKTCFFIIAVR